MVNNTVYHFVGSNLGVEIFLKKREDQKKGALTKILQNGAKLIKNTDSWFKKSHEEFGQLQASSGKV